MNEITTPQVAKTTRAGAPWGLLAACLVLAIAAIILGMKAHSFSAQLSDTQAQLAGAKAETSQALADLGKARDASAGLQAQLDKAKAGSSDLQAQLDTAKGQYTVLQAQVEKVKAASASQAAALQVRLDLATASAADLQAQLGQANARSADLLTQVDRLRGQSKDLQALLEKSQGDLARLQPMVAKARHIPLTAAFERSNAILGLATHTAYTLTISSLQTQPLNVDISVTGPERTSKASLVVVYGETTRFPKLAAGENVVISSVGYEPLSLVVQ